MWVVILRPTFIHWLNQQTESVADSIMANIELLRTNGPLLGRPYSDTVQGSKFRNMKELRVQHLGRPYRAFFAFDPKRQAIVLCAGDKTGDKRFYEKMIPLADKEFSQHLEETNL